jgi:hypothetical protein
MRFDGAGDQSDPPPLLERPQALKGLRVRGFKVYYDDGEIKKGEPGEWNSVQEDGIQVVTVYTVEILEFGIPGRKIMCGFDFYWPWDCGNVVPDGVGRVIKGRWMRPYERFEEIRQKALYDYYF